MEQQCEAVFSDDILIKKEQIEEETIPIVCTEADIEKVGEEGVQVVTDQDHVPISLDDFVEYHNQQVRNLKSDIACLTKNLEIFHRFKIVYDMAFEEYFREDTKFKFRSVLEDLELDFMQFIAENEEKYYRLVSDLDVQIEFNDDDEQFAFIEEDDADPENGMSMFELYSFNNFFHSERFRAENFVVNNDAPVYMHKLPGQHSAPKPECPACGQQFRCRIKLEGHLLEHEDNPFVVCNIDNCNLPYNLKKLPQHMKQYHSENDLVCEVCNEAFDSKTMLVQHYKLHIQKRVCIVSLVFSY